MKKLFLLAAVCLASCVLSFGQGTVRGKITDENGETLIGVTIVLKSNRSLGTTTYLDGNYTLKVSDTTAQTLIVSFISYKAIEETIHLSKNQVLVKNFTLLSSAKEIKEVVIQAKAVKAKEYYTEAIKKNSATSVDYISSETMKKTGDVNVTAAVARVPGVSTTSTGIITVRGIGDRYVKTSINGSRIPTLDPFTNNIKLDLFPASLVDNILITKTASPDLPGDWAGAYMSVETKDYPENLSVNVESSFGYNSQTTFKDFVSSQRSSTDWLGYDNNFRDHNHNSFVSANVSPTQYSEFVALGLGPYFNSLGITEQNWYSDNSNGETYFKLGLVELGLLAPALINDNNEFRIAKNEYLNGSFESDAFKTINASVPESGKSFPNNWNTIQRKASLDLSQSFSIGNQTKLFGKPLGFLFGYRYGNSIKSDPMATSNRPRFDGSLESAVTLQNSIETNGWSALMNVAYKFNPNQSVSFLFMPNVIGVNKVQDALDNRDSTQFVITKSQFYEQRRQLVYQFKSENYLPGPKLKSELNVSYTNGKSSIPDFKNLQYWKDEKGNTYQIGGSIGDGVHRYYRYLSDDLFDSRISFELPLGNKPGLIRKVKTGGAYQRNDKKSDQYDYQLFLGENSSLALQNNDLDAFFSLDNFGISSGVNNGIPYSTINEYYTEASSPANHTFGKSEITAGFIMMDYAVVPRLRFSGGVRIEHADIFTDVYRFDSLGYAVNDPRRVYSAVYPLVNPGKLTETSFLPSANIIYKLRNEEATPFNIRLNYSQTIARPSIRELSDVANLDYEYRTFVFGNSDLKSVHINNYDLRLESYFKSGDNVSLSLFYKDFKNHIELVKSVGLTWHNVDQSYVAGIELEGKKILTKHLELRANVALIKSQTEFVRSRMDISSGVKTYISEDTLKRTMFGQAPYVVNGIISYTSDSLGLSITLSYNVQGERLVITSDNKAIPDIYERPRHLVDFKVTKSLGKHFSVNMTVRDVLNSSIQRVYKGWNIDYDKYTYGTNYVLGILYKL